MFFSFKSLFNVILLFKSLSQDLIVVRVLVLKMLISFLSSTMRAACLANHKFLT